MTREFPEKSRSKMSILLNIFAKCFSLGYFVSLGELVMRDWILAPPTII